MVFSVLYNLHHHQHLHLHVRLSGCYLQQLQEALEGTRLSWAPAGVRHPAGAGAGRPGSTEGTTPELGLQWGSGTRPGREQGGQGALRVPRLSWAPAGVRHPAGAGAGRLACALAKCVNVLIFLSL